MTQRKYSVAEIDRMRQKIYWAEVMRGSTKLGIGDAFVSRPYLQAELNASIEDKLRTYMLAGIDPEELEAALRETMP